MKQFSVSDRIIVIKKEKNMDLSKKNFIKYCWQIAAYSIAFMFLNGAITQSFFLYVGLSEKQVYAYSSITQLAQVLVMVLMIFISGRIKRGRLYSGIANLFMVAPLILLMIGAVDPSAFDNTFVIVLFLATFITFGGIGMYGVLSYCLPLKLVNVADYGKLTGVTGAVSGIITFALSSLHSFLISNFDYLVTEVWFLLLAIISAIVSGVMFFFMKELPSVEETEERSTLSEMVEVFKNPDTYYLLIPNFARGLALGVFNVLAVMAVGSGVADAGGAAALAIVIQAASFAASTVFTVTYKKLTVERLIILSTLGASLTLPFVLSLDFTFFIILSFVSIFFRFIVDSAIPTALIKIIPESQIGAYSSIRMLVFTAAQAVSAALVPSLIATVGYFGVLVIAAVLQLVCGIGHYLVAVKKPVKVNYY